MFRKILSYFLPINILTQKSTINKSIEVTWNNGKLVLDTENTNYSYGSLQKVLRKGLLEIGFEKIKKFENILILGVAGGSVIKTLVDEIKFEGKIVGVEIDSQIIEIANKYFDLNKIQNLEIVIEDASKFVKNHTYIYDLIIIDIFQDSFMPEFLFEEDFIQNTLALLNEKGIVIFNTIANSKIKIDRNAKFINFNQSKNIFVRKLSKLEGDNELIIIQKKT